MGDHDAALGDLGGDLGERARDVLVGQAVEAVAADAVVVKRRGSANQSASPGWLRWKAVSKQATWARSGRAAATARMPARLCG
jgi:hypothetical protein